MIGLRWPDLLHEEMDAEGRFENTLEGLITLILVESLRQPLILHVEDAQWLDADLLTLLERLWRRINELADCHAVDRVSGAASRRHRRETVGAGRRPAVRADRPASPDGR